MISCFLIAGTIATFEWAEASGPVAGYWVENLATERWEQVQTNSVTLVHYPPEGLTIRVQAYDLDANVGPPSVISQEVYFLGDWLNAWSFQSFAAAFMQGCLPR